MYHVHNVPAAFEGVLNGQLTVVRPSLKNVAGLNNAIMSLPKKV